MENILFFGATGKLGRYWVKELNKKHKVFVNLHKNKNFLKKNKSLIVKLSIDNHDKLLKFCISNEITRIINCVGFSNVELCERQKKKALKLNFFIPSELCKIANKLDIPFVHISTDMLYDGSSKKKYDEKARCSSINFYSKTKIKAEKFISKYNKSLIIRSNFFGFCDKNNQSITDKILSDQKLKEKTFLWKDIYFTPMYLPILVFFLNLLLQNNYNGIFNISSDEVISKFNFGKKVLKKIFEKNYIIPTSFDNKNFVNRPKNMSLNNQKLKKIFKKYSYKLKLDYQLKMFFNDYKKY